MMQNRMTESEEQDAYIEHERYSPYLLANSEDVTEGEYVEPVCDNCGDNHSTENCPFLKQDENIIDGDVDEEEENAYAQET